MVSLELEARLDNLLSTAQTETANIDLFAPIPEREECPICMLPHPIDEEESSFQSCCGKLICRGCILKNLTTEKNNGVDLSEHKCVFCRQSWSTYKVNDNKALKKLMKKNNIRSFIQMANKFRLGNGVLQSDTRALEMYIRAAELGHNNAYALIAHCYEQGSAVEEDLSKSIEFSEIAAKKGSVYAHKRLAHFAVTVSMDLQRSYNHLKVAACAECQKSWII